MRFRKIQSRLTLFLVFVENLLIRLLFYADDAAIFGENTPQLYTTAERLSTKLELQKEIFLSVSW